MAARITSESLPIEEPTLASRSEWKIMPNVLAQLTGEYLSYSDLLKLAAHSPEQERLLAPLLIKMKECNDSSYEGLLCDDKEWSESNPQCQTWCTGLTSQEREHKAWDYIQEFHKFDSILRPNTSGSMWRLHRDELKEKEKKEEDKKYLEVREQEKKLINEWKSLPEPVKRAMIKLWEEKENKVQNRIEEWQPEYKGFKQDVAWWVVYQGPEAIESVLENPQAEFERSPYKYWSEWNPTNIHARAWWASENNNPLWELVYGVGE